MGPEYVLQFLFSQKSQNHYNSTTTEAVENIRTDLESLELIFCYVLDLVKKNNQILQNKIISQYVFTTKICTW